ncbi:hypothetical protein J14TS2_11520 [Bacillus sp. J14TS2]|nr:hypothetical protein J14TS2_11520 [Bacillus sp. J14TS2]
MSEQYNQRLWRSCKTEWGFLHCAKICESGSPFFMQFVRIDKEALFTKGMYFQENKQYRFSVFARHAMNQTTFGHIVCDRRR